MTISDEFQAQVKELETKWLARCDEIRKQELDDNQSYSIVEQFINEAWQLFQSRTDEEFNKYRPLVNSLLSDLYLSTSIAISNFRKKKKNNWPILIAILLIGVHFILPSIYGWGGWTLPDENNRVWWVGETMIFIGIPFLIILKRLGFSPKVKWGDAEVTIPWDDSKR